MEDLQPSRLKDPRPFPGRIGRKLSLSLAVIITLVLIVGGVSLLLARSISRTNQEIKQQSQHTEVMSAVQFQAQQLIVEVTQVVVTGDGTRTSRVDSLAQRIVSLLQEYGEIHESKEDFPEKRREQRAIVEVRATISKLLPVSRKVLETLSAGKTIDRQTIDFLNGVNLRMPALFGEVNEIHQAKIQRLIGDSSNRMNVLLGIYLAFVLVGAALLIGGSVIFSRRIVSPIQILAEATREIARGNLDREVPVTSGDEIGELSHSFNQMARKLEEHERQLHEVNQQLQSRVREAQALNCIGVEISKLLDLDKILQSVVERARELLQCEVVALCLVENGDRLVLKATSGPPEAFSTRLDSSGSEKSVGVPADLPDHLVLCSLIAEKYRSVHCAVPLKSGENVVGALCAADSRPRDFSEAERELLAGLATQATIAIQNARLYEQMQGLAVLKERERIAREMHDGLAQSLGYLHLKIRSAENLLGPSPDPKVAEEVRAMRRVIEEAYEEVRQSIFGLRTMVSRGLGVIPTLTEYLHDFSERNGIPVDLQIPTGQEISFPPAGEVQLIRIIQEALANVRKHAQAKRARIAFEVNGTSTQVTVADDGRGFDPKETLKAGRLQFGLQTMRERAESLGGKLEVISAPGKGTRVLVHIPRGA
ncbi:MAG: HAMP domain-containing protein [Candidatus Tectomicrobia bacterium]|uniref:histidine kinase n=1 Tax=Tectimicrobiota bacterium TaxID=2528274 RepID=A0A932GNF8_UNCTE|nr:HAMP domain-containing protein [Candidatus Tectomicrobia bacterium]